MKAIARTCLVLGVICLLGAPAFGDWGTDPYKWLQYPDLWTTGVDVDCTTHPGIPPMRTLADDFLCNSLDPITDVHIWGSWLGDYLPEDASGVQNPNAVAFRLRIMSDVPVGPQGGYSQPGAVLWEHIFQPGEYLSRQYATGLQEWFYDPVTGRAMFPGDTVCWQYNFYLPEAFQQKGTKANPVVYWLGVEAIVQDPQAEFGWKSSLMKWNDDATWRVDETAPWNELMYPTAHPYHEDSMNLAFVITTPEPSSVVLLLSGAVGLLLCGWRRWKRS
jgi:hypothetical protein